MGKKAQNVHVHNWNVDGYLTFAQRQREKCATKTHNIARAPKEKRGCKLNGNYVNCNITVTRSVHSCKNRTTKHIVNVQIKRQ